MKRVPSKIALYLALSGLLLQSTFHPAFAQDGRAVGVRQTQEKRLALVIGNGAYTNAPPLTNPANDANDMTATLKSLGFEVLSGTNQNKKQMESLIREFGDKLARQGGVGLFFYAGHGIQVRGNNYLVPVEADIPQEDEVDYAAINLSFLMGKMDAAQNNLNIIILDACRNNPFARKWRNFRDMDINSGLAKVTPPTGTIMLYATQPGNVASDGAGRNGLFTESLLKQIKKPNVELDAMIKLLARDVSQKSGGKQFPWKEGIILGDFYFAVDESVRNEAKPNETQAIILKPTPLPNPTPVFDSGNFDAEAVYWKEIENRNTKSGYELYLAEYPNGRFAKAAKDRITEFNNQEAIRLKNIEKNKWQDAAQQNTRESYNDYLNSYPNGEYANSARQKIKDIEDKEARKKAEIENAREQTKWDEVSILNRKSAYQAYLADYPVGRYSAIAKTKIKEFENEEARILLEQQKSKDKSAWEEAERLKTIKGYEDYLKAYPNGNSASLARLRLNDLGKVVLKKNSTGMEFVYIPTGTFQMGSTHSDYSGYEARPVHQVTISKPFEMGKYEVTQGEWKAVMGSLPTKCDHGSLSGDSMGDRKPIICVSWKDIQQFISKLNGQNDSYRYRLPTEAEWEYACRAGTSGDYAGDLDSMAWYDKNSGGNLHEIGTKSQNMWGLYDMHGNVWEWVQDWYGDYTSGSVTDPTGPSTGSSRVFRGGSWNSIAEIVRSAFRSYASPSYRGYTLGFRLLRTPL